jgi:hypothetical protein
MGQHFSGRLFANQFSRALISFSGRKENVVGDGDASADRDGMKVSSFWSFLSAGLLFSFAEAWPFHQRRCAFRSFRDCPDDVHGHRYPQVTARCRPLLVGSFYFLSVDFPAPVSLSSVLGCRLLLLLRWILFHWFHSDEAINENFFVPEYSHGRAAVDCCPARKVHFQPESADGWLRRP